MCRELGIYNFARNRQRDLVSQLRIPGLFQTLFLLKNLFLMVFGEVSVADMMEAGGIVAIIWSTFDPLQVIVVRVVSIIDGLVVLRVATTTNSHYCGCIII